MSNLHLHLPEEIIHEILLRLPVKTLLRFRCVSNPWRNLISSPKFAKLHLKQTSEHNADMDHHSVLIASSSSSQFMTMIFNNLSESPYHYNDLKLQCAKWFDISNYTRILGCCNGLVFLRLTFEDVAIWNPSTRDYKLLPKPGLELNQIRFCGLGFDASIDDYKAVVSSYNYPPATSINLQLEVFTLKTNTWRKVVRIHDIEEFPYWASAPGNLSNGALHWLRKYDATIMSFDFVQEQLGKFVSLPDSTAPPALKSSLEVNYMEFMELGVLQGCLCLYIPKLDFMNNTQVWVMKEYGVNSSWSKVLSINISFPAYVGHSEFIKPLCILKSGEILLLINQRKLLTYSPTDNTCKTICHDGIWVRAVVYAESLVSLN